MAFLTKMLIQICEDVIDAVLDKKSPNHDRAIQVLKDSSTVVRKGWHLIYLDNESLNKLLKYRDGGLDFELFKRLKQKKATVYSCVSKIPFRALITFERPTTKTAAGIIINPALSDRFNIIYKTRLLCENIYDCYFYECVCEFYKRTHCLIGGKTSYEPMQGGGGTTYEVYQVAIDNGSFFELAIADNDKTYPGDSEEGSTAARLRSCDPTNNKYFNVHWYVMKNVAEIENLVPWKIVLKLCPNAMRFQYKIDRSFFDLKKGIGCKKIKEKEEGYYNYWKAQFRLESTILEQMDKARNCNKKCSKDCEDKFDVVKAVDGKIMDEVCPCKDVKESKDGKGTKKGNAGVEFLRNVKEKDLEPSQLSEWNTIGKLVFEWCCGSKPIRV